MTWFQIFSLSSPIVILTALFGRLYFRMADLEQDIRAKLQDHRYRIDNTASSERENRENIYSSLKRHETEIEKLTSFKDRCESAEWKRRRKQAEDNAWREASTSIEERTV